MARVQIGQTIQCDACYWSETALIGNGPRVTLRCTWYKSARPDRHEIERREQLRQMALRYKCPEFCYEPGAEG